MIPSVLEKYPSIKSNIGKNRYNTAKADDLFIILLLNLNFPAIMVPTPITKVRYITPAPITFPIDNWGTFLMLELMAINNSGRVDAEDMIKEATMNSLHFKILDILDNAFTIQLPALAIIKNEIMKTKIDNNIIYVYYTIFNYQK